MYMSHVTGKPTDTNHALTLFFKSSCSEITLTTSAQGVGHYCMHIEKRDVRIPTDHCQVSVRLGMSYVFHIFQRSGQVEFILIDSRLVAVRVSTTANNILPRPTTATATERTTECHIHRLSIFIGLCSTTMKNNNLKKNCIN